MGNYDFQTLNELFLKAIERHDKPDCFLSKSGGQYQDLSSREALRKVVALASALARMGVRKGDRVALLSENRLEWALTDYAVLGLGAINVPIHPTFLGPDLEYVLRDSGAKGIVVSTEPQLQKVLSVRPKLVGLAFVLAMDCAKLAGADVLCWKDIVESELSTGAQLTESFRSQALEVGPRETASVLYTSGTTGRPKGVVLTHANLVANVQASADLFPLGRDDVAMSFLPLSHVYERMLDYQYVWLGVAIGYAESFEALPANLRELRPKVMAVVPRVLEKIHDKVMETVRQASPFEQRLFHWAISVGRESIPYRLERRPLPLGLRLKRALADALVFSRVRAQLGGRLEVLLSGAAPLSQELAEFFHAIGLPVYEGYGLTETSPVIAVNCPRHVKLGTVGRVIAGVEIKLGEELTDQRGGEGREILVRGPNVSPGYYRLDEENRQAFVDGWFRTGDLGRLDREGYLTITGRKKNLFKTSGGKYVSPEKLENLFQGHPYVVQIMVLGETRKFVGALVVPNFERLEAYAREHGFSFKSREELVANPQVRAFIEQQVDETTRLLSPHEKIRQLVLLPHELTIAAGELSATLKIKRRVVEERYRDLIEEMFLRHAPQSQPGTAVSP